MKQETLKVLADSSNILTASTGVGTSAWGFAEYWGFVNTNAAGIGVLLTLLFGLIAIGFNFYNSSKLNKVDENKKKIDDHGDRLHSHIQDTEKSFNHVNSGIDEILSKLKLTSLTVHITTLAGLTSKAGLMMAVNKLTPKQDAFVKAYLLNGGNATQAAITAGYSKKTANEQGAQNLVKLSIKEAIAKHQQKNDDSYIWSKADKLKRLEKLIESCSKSDKEKGALNAAAAISAIKEHNLMQGDNAPTEIVSTVEVRTTLDDFYG